MTRPLVVPGGLLGVSPPGAVRDFRRLVFPRVVLPDRALARRFVAAFDALRHAPEPLAREEALAEFLAGVLERGAVETTMGQAAAPRALRRARELLDAAVDARLSPDDLARASGLGKFALLRGFRRAVGLTPYAYHLRVRLAAARRMLRSGLTVAAVAQATGFADQSHLARHFAWTFGLPPVRHARMG